VEEVRRQLARIRDPLFQHLPVSYLTKLEEDATTKEEGAQTKYSPDVSKCPAAFSKFSLRNRLLKVAAFKDRGRAVV
ncbi:hypothetical protein TELCIR_24396, partial [Teladorsagia circumcincta]